MSLFFEKMVASIALGLVVVVEFNHSFIQQIPWAGFTLFVNNVSPFLIVAWVLAMVGLWVNESVLKFFQYVGLLLLCVHSFFLLIGSNKIVGVFYFIAFLISAIFSYLVEVDKNKERKAFI